MIWYNSHGSKFAPLPRCVALLSQTKPLSQGLLRALYRSNGKAKVGSATPKPSQTCGNRSACCLGRLGDAGGYGVQLPARGGCCRILLAEVLGVELADFGVRLSDGSGVAAGLRVSGSLAASWISAL